MSQAEQYEIVITPRQVDLGSVRALRLDCRTWERVKNRTGLLHNGGANKSLTATFLAAVRDLPDRTPEVERLIGYLSEHCRCGFSYELGRRSIFSPTGEQPSAPALRRGDEDVDPEMFRVNHPDPKPPAPKPAPRFVTSSKIDPKGR